MVTTVWIQRDEAGTLGRWSEVEQFGDHWETIDSQLEEFWAILNPPPPMPPEISRRQFFQVLANRDMITKAEGLAAVTSGALFAGAQTFNRSHGYVDFFGAMRGTTSVASISSGATPTFWIEAAKSSPVASFLTQYRWN
ncbi:hypothetical protein [Rhizobium sp. Root1220]|uniref:hypothetical protein n=1 Tax=Rhizobium sp. Root1220 TaxID=1736432 RepID=UPI0006F7C82D|nr:hypothetical protein [Rhizobium sp. Root1220]KQV81871.1 hypothetical protein ASC90_24780 [Rhizobium sp. Root1220]